MKNLFFVSVIFSIFSGTSLPAIAQKHINAVSLNDGSPARKSFKFIEGIEIKADNIPGIQPAIGKPAIKGPVSVENNRPAEILPEIEKISSLQFKYAQLLDRNVEEIKNISLISFIEEWLETRYHYGGTTKKGIDCSAFTGLLMGCVYSIKLPRTAREQYNFAVKLGEKDMTEGDLVFFKIKHGVSHVGVCLGNGYFVHASRNNGVTISNLDDPYYSSRFIGAGRIIYNENIVAGP